MPKYTKPIRRAVRATGHTLISARFVTPLERAWVRPESLTHYSLRTRLRDDGCIRGGNWDQPGRALVSRWRHRCCRLHWQDGQTWEETGAYTYMAAEIEASEFNEVDGCRTPEDVRERYARLDALFAIMQAEGLPSRATNVRGHWIEQDPVRINIGRSGQLFSGYGAMHRIAMTHILGLERIPVGIALVHLRFLPELAKRRRPDARALDWYVA